MPEAPLIAQLDFHPIPPSERRSPGRVKSIPARLYIDQWEEHRQAFSFLQQQQQLHGEGSKTLVRSLIHYRNTVILPLEEWQEKQASSPRKRQSTPPQELLIALLAFQPVPPSHRHEPARVKNVSARLYIDKWLEHREAYEFLVAQQQLHGQGLKTIVRALIHYRDTVVAPMTKDPVDTGAPQLALDVEAEG